MTPTDDQLCQRAFEYDPARASIIVGGMRDYYERGFHAALAIARSNGTAPLHAESAFADAVDRAMEEACSSGLSGSAACGILLMKIRLIQDEAMALAGDNK